MGLHDRMQATPGRLGGTFEPIRIPALDLSDAFAAFDPHDGVISPYPWAPLQRPAPALDGSSGKAHNEDPEGLNALAARARAQLGELSGSFEAMALSLDSALATATIGGDVELPALGEGDFMRTVLQRSEALEAPGPAVPRAHQWLAVLALALLGKAEQLIREIDRDAERIFAVGPADLEFFQNEFNLDRLQWFRHLAAEIREVVAAAEAVAINQMAIRERSADYGREGGEKANAESRELKRRAEAIFREEFANSKLSNQRVALRLWKRIEPHNYSADGRPILWGQEPERDRLPVWVAEFRKRLGEPSTGSSTEG